MKRKAFLVILLLAAVLLLACGCAETFTYTYYIDGSGAIHKVYRLTYDPAAADADLVKSEAVYVMEEMADTFGWTDYAEIDDSTSGVVEMELYYPSIAEYYIAAGLTGREPNEADEYETSGIFRVYEQELPSYLTEDALSTLAHFLGVYYDDVDLDACDCYYVYGTTLKTIESNADSVTEDSGIYYHRWRIDPNDTKEMIIKQYALNGVLFYGVIISVFVLSIVVIFVIIYSTDRKNKKKFRSPSAGGYPFDGREGDIYGGIQ